MLSWVVPSAGIHRWRLRLDESQSWRENSTHSAVANSTFFDSGSQNFLSPEFAGSKFFVPVITHTGWVSQNVLSHYTRVPNFSHCYEPASRVLSFFVPWLWTRFAGSQFFCHIVTDPLGGSHKYLSQYHGPASGSIIMGQNILGPSTRVCNNWDKIFATCEFRGQKILGPRVKKC